VTATLIIITLLLLIFLALIHIATLINSIGAMWGEWLDEQNKDKEVGLDS
jgi:hypothetical protein